MPEQPLPEQEAIFNPETHHEKSDVSVRGLMLFIALFIVFGVATHFLLWVLYRGFVRIERRRQPLPVTEMQRPADMAVPRNQPLLQPFPRQGPDGQPVSPNQSTPLTDLAAMREAEQRILSSYGWVDRQKGLVRIPIEQAMRLTLERGLPVQAAAPVERAAPGARP